VERRAIATIRVPPTNHLQVQFLYLLWLTSQLGYMRCVKFSPADPSRKSSEKGKKKKTTGQSETCTGPGPSINPDYPDMLEPTSGLSRKTPRGTDYRARDPITPSLDQRGCRTEHQQAYTKPDPRNPPQAFGLAVHKNQWGPAIGGKKQRSGAISTL